MTLLLGAVPFPAMGRAGEDLQGKLIVLCKGSSLVVDDQGTARTLTGPGIWRYDQAGGVHKEPGEPDCDGREREDDTTQRNDGVDDAGASGGDTFFGMSKTTAGIATALVAAAIVAHELDDDGGEDAPLSP
ncbi:MAG TPA: hypothetical protein VFK18_06330 [Luteimonas sp.]|nr:hypothetical protein [Luteimonas sp.]